MDILTYALAKKYTDKALLGIGTIKGAPCTVKSQTEDDEYVYVTLGWESNLGTSEETVVKIKKGADGAPGPAGDPGPRGFSITKIEKIKTEGLIDTYQITFSDDTTFEYTVSNGSDDYFNMNNKPSIEGVELIGNKTFEDLNIASAGDLSATDGHLQDLSDLIGDKTNLPMPTDTVVDNITLVDSKVDAIIDDNETGLAKTFSSDKITKTFATLEEVNERIPQYDTLPTPTEACGGQVVQFIGTTTEDYIHNYFYECVQVEDSYKWVNVAVQNVPTKLSELTNDNNFVTATELNEKGYLTEHQDISGKVDKEEGKSLIADSEITRLSTVKNYDDSAVKEDIATIKTDYATKTYVGEQIAAADHLKREIVTEVPTAETAVENVIYMLKVESTVGADKYKEYMLIDGEVACVGDTSVDLTDYAKKSEIPTELPANGGNADTVNTHTVASDVPEDAIFTDTVYDDIEIKDRISKQENNLTNLKVSEIAGGKNLADINAFKQLTIAEKSDRYGYEWFDMKGGSYTFTITNDTQRVYLGYEHEGVVVNPYSIGSETASFTITISDHDNIAVWYDENAKVNTITKIQLEEGSEATEYEPYIPSVKMLVEKVEKKADKSETTVNLLNPTLQTTTAGGVTCTKNGDGTYTLNGTSGSSTSWLQLGPVSLKANTSYKLIGQSSTYGTIDARIYDNNGVYFNGGTYKGATPIITPTVDITLNMQIRIGETTTLDNFIVRPMITTNLDATYDDFVPYTGNTGKLNSDVAVIKKDIINTSQEIISSETKLTSLIDDKTKIADKYVSKPKVLKYTNVGTIAKNDIFTGVSTSTSIYATNDANYTSSYTDAIIIVTDQDLEYLKTTTTAVSFGKYISYRSSSGELTEYNCSENEQVALQSGDLMIYPTGNAITISGIYPEEFAKYGFPEIDGEITVQDVLNNYVEDKIYMDVAVKGKTVSMLNYNNYKTHYTLNTSTGKEEKTTSANDDTILMNFLPIAENLKYLFSDRQTRALFLYDEDKNFLSIKSITPPIYLTKADFESSNSKAAYFRFELLYQQNQNSKYQIMPNS